MRERVNTSCLSACIRSLTCIIRRRHPTGLDVGTRADHRYTSCAGTCRFSASRRSCAALASPRPMTCQCVTNGFGSKTVIAGRGFYEIQFISVFWQGNKNAPLARRWTPLEKIKYLHIIRWWCYANLCRSSSCVLIQTFQLYMFQANEWENLCLAPLFRKCARTKSVLYELTKGTLPM